MTLKSYDVMTSWRRRHCRWRWHWRSLLIRHQLTVIRYRDLTLLRHSVSLAGDQRASRVMTTQDGGRFTVLRRRRSFHFDLSAIEWTRGALTQVPVNFTIHTWPRAVIDVKCGWESVAQSRLDGWRHSLRHFCSGEQLWARRRNRLSTVWKWQHNKIKCTGCKERTSRRCTSE